MTKPITKEELWNQVKAKFYQEIGPVSFDTYIEPLAPITLTESRIILEVPADESTDIIDNWNKSYAMSFVQYAMEIAEGFIKPELRVAETLPKSTPIQTENLTFTRESDLNENFTFDKFCRNERSVPFKKQKMHSAQARGPRRTVGSVKSAKCRVGVLGRRFAKGSETGIAGNIHSRELSLISVFDN